MKVGVQTRVVWSIGTLDGGPEQFHGSWPPDAVAHIDVDRDDLSLAMPRTHPGPLDGSSGFREHVLRLSFSLAAVNPDGYDLVLRVKAMTGPAPSIEATVGGRTGLLLVRPTRDGVPGLHWPTTIGGWEDLTTAIPAELFSPGSNVLELRTVCLDDVDPAEQRAPHPAFRDVFGSLLVHAGMELRDRGSPPPAPTIELVPTPLYVDSPNGLDELVDLVLTGPSPAADVQLDIAGTTVSRTLPALAFGQARVRVPVPELADEAGASVRWGEAELTTVLVPCRKWTLHLIPHVHLDIGFTDYQGKVAELHSRNLDRVRDLLRADPSYRFTLDGSWVVDQYLSSRSSESGAWLLEALRSGTISVNAYWCLFLTGLASLDELYHSLRYSDRLAREHGVPADCANLTDVPSYSWSIPSTLAASGVRSFLGVANHFRAENARTEELHALSPFRWVGPDGGEVTTFLARHYAQLRYLAADPPSVSGCAEGFSRYVARYERPNYLPHDLPIVGINSDNEDLAHGEADLVRRWHARYAWPRLRFSTVPEYFAAIEPLREDLPRVSGDGGSYWEDGVGAHAATMATYRETQALLPSAEGLQAMLSTVDRRLRPSVEALDGAWDRLVIGGEHTWTSDHSVDRPHSHTTVDQLDWKTTQVHGAWRIAWDEHRRGMSQLGELVTTSGSSLLVHNGCSWPREGSVVVELPTGTVVLDEGERRLKGDLLHRDGGLDRVHLAVPEVPSLGYSAFRLRAGEAYAAAAPRGVSDELLTVGAYDVGVVAGRLTSLRHHGSGRELLDGSGVSLAEVLHVSGGGTAEGLGLGHEATSLYNVDWHLPAPDLQVTAVPVTWTVARTAIGWTLTGTGAGPGMREVVTTLRFAEHDDTVQVVVHLDKQSVRAKEALYVAFPFAVDEPTFHYDRQQGWVDPVRDHTAGACNEWFTVQDAVLVGGLDDAIAWTSVHAPLWVVGSPVTGRWPSHFEATSSTVLSYVVNNYWHTNFPAVQSGQLTFEYAFAPVANRDFAAAARLGRHARLPLLAQEVNQLDKARDLAGALPGSGSLIDVAASPGIQVSVAAARHHEGTVLRCREVSGLGGNVTLRGPALVISPTEHVLAAAPADHTGDVIVRLEPWAVIHLLTGSTTEMLG